MSTSRARARGRSLRSDDADVKNFFEDFFLLAYALQPFGAKREKEKSSAQKEKEKKIARLCPETKSGEKQKLKTSGPGQALPSRHIKTPSPSCAHRFATSPCRLCQS